MLEPRALVEDVKSAAGVGDLGMEAVVFYLTISPFQVNTAGVSYSADEHGSKYLGTAGGSG